MSIESLCSLHSVTPYPLVQTKDTTTLDTIETLGEAGDALDCRALLLSEGTEKDAEQRSQPRKMRFRFSSDPGLTISHVLVYEGDPYRVTDVDNASEMSWIWIVTAEHVKQLEVTA